MAKPFAPFPYKITWDITHKCNLRCTHCFVIYQKNISETSIKDDQYLRIAKDIVALRPFCISISGGEPFLVPSLTEIVAHFCEQNIDVIVATNGSLLTEDIINDLSRSKKASLQISIDGASAHDHDAIRGRDAFRSARRGVTLAAGRLPVTVAVTITDRIMTKIGEIFELAINASAQRLKFHRMIVGRSVPAKNLAPSMQGLFQIEQELRDCIERYEGMIDVIHPFVGGGRKGEFSIGSCNVSRNMGVGLRECTITPSGKMVTCGATIDDEIFSESILNGNAQNAWNRLQLQMSRSSRGCLCDY